MMTRNLSDVLARYPAALRPLSVPESLGNAGGMSGSLFWRFRSGAGEFVAHAWPEGTYTRPWLERIHRWIAEAGWLGFLPVPRPARDGRTVQEGDGRLWEVVPWMPGTVATSSPPDENRVRAGFAALAAVHQCLISDRTRGPSPGLLARYTELSEIRATRFSEWEACLSRQPDGPLRSLALRWLEAARPVQTGVLEALSHAVGVTVPLQPCLRDVRPDHLLFTGERVTGLVDFGAAGIDTVAGDVSRLLSEWLGNDARQRAAALDAYHAVRPLDLAELALIDVFERSSALLGPAHWMRWHFVEGRRFEDPSAVARGLEKGLNRLAALKL